MLELIRKYPRLLLFGVLTAAFSGPGQTFLVSLFIPAMRETYGLSQAKIAGYYSLMTLVSACLLPLTGRILDKSHLARFTCVAGALLGLGCFILGYGQSLFLLLLGFFLIRNLGQGTLTMVSSTTMARIFGALRGKALGISQIGYPTGEAIFPALITFWIATYGWRSGWFFLSGLVFFLFIPATLFLLWGDPHHDARESLKEHHNPDQSINQGQEWSVGQMLKDYRFYILIIPILIPATFFTGLFFHQISLMEWKGWSMKVISMGFVAYGICRAFVAFFIGPLIDRFTATKLFPTNLIPFIFALLCLWLGKDEIYGFIYLALSGMTMGLGMTMSSALYAEFYGTKALGSIKGVMSALVVFSTAVSPVVMGWLLDVGVDPAHMIVAMIVMLFVGTFCSWLVCCSNWLKKV